MRKKISNKKRKETPKKLQAMKKGKENSELRGKEAIIYFAKELAKAACEIEALCALPKKKSLAEDKKEKKTEVVYGNHQYIKSIRDGFSGAFLYTMHCQGKLIATVCLIKSPLNIYVRGIAICGPTDDNITIAKGRDVAYRRAKFAMIEHLSTCRIRRDNKFIRIIREIFYTKYKAQYRAILTEHEERMINQDDVRNMRYYTTPDN